MAGAWHDMISDEISRGDVMMGTRYPMTRQTFDWMTRPSAYTATERQAWAVDDVARWVMRGDIALAREAAVEVAQLRDMQPTPQERNAAVDAALEYATA